MNRNRRLRELALDESPLASIIVDTGGILAYANHNARLLFSLDQKDFGRPLQDLEISSRPTELRSLIEQAYAERRAVKQASVERRVKHREVRYLEVVAQPLYDEGEVPLGVGLSFVDVTRSSELLEELAATNEELQSTNEELKTMDEELRRRTGRGPVGRARR